MSALQTLNYFNLKLCHMLVNILIHKYNNESIRLFNHPILKNFMSLIILNLINITKNKQNSKSRKLFL